MGRTESWLWCQRNSSEFLHTHLVRWTRGQNNLPMGFEGAAWVVSAETSTLMYLMTWSAVMVSTCSTLALMLMQLWFRVGKCLKMMMTQIQGDYSFTSPWYKTCIDEVPVMTGVLYPNVAVTMVFAYLNLESVDVLPTEEDPCANTVSVTTTPVRSYCTPWIMWHTFPGTTAHCMITDDSHIRTYDGAMLHVKGTCKYLLTGTCAGYNTSWPPSFQLHLRNQKVSPDSNQVIAQYLELHLDGRILRLYADQRVTVSIFLSSFLIVIQSLIKLHL